MKLIVGLLVSLFISANLSAQDLMVKTDGNTGYLTHTVGPKENYYSIGRIYNISPRTYAPYNNLKLEIPMSIGQAVRIPLVQQNYSLDNSGNANEAFVPLYYLVQEKEGLFKVGQHFGISADDLKKLNGLKTDAVNIGDKLVIGYLKVLKDQSPLAANAKAGKPVVKNVETGVKSQENIVKSEPKKEDKPVVKQEASSQQPDVVKNEPKKEEKPVVKQETPKVEEKKKVVNKEEFKEGVFRNEYFGQTNNGSNTQSAEAMCGVFKSSSGWSNGKYYALMNGVERGTIVKIMVNGRAVYAKVLDAVPNVKENDGLNILISNAAAAQLEVNEQKFNVGVMWSK